MELYEAPALRQLLRAGALPPMRAVAIAAQVARALAYAHERGVTHRDVKPENLLVGAGDQAKLVDFGLAQVDGATLLTQEGQRLGTARYMAPEQVRGAGVGPHTDVYALGLMMIEMVTGTAPFAGEEWTQRLARSPQPLPPDPALGDRLSRIVAACVELEAARRPTAAQLADQLESLRA